MWVKILVKVEKKVQSSKLMEKNAKRDTVMLYFLHFYTWIYYCVRMPMRLQW